MANQKDSKESKPKLSIVQEEESTPPSVTGKKAKKATKKSQENVNAEENSPESSKGDYTTPAQNPVDVAIAQMDPGNRKVLDGMYLHGMSIRKACEYAGVKYYHSKTTITQSEIAQPYIQHLLERADVIREFHVDDMHLVELVKIRNRARSLGQEGAAVRAHEICMKAIGRLSKEEKPPDPLKSVGEMTREEMLEEFSRYKMKADGKPLENLSESVKSEKEELLQRDRPPAASTSPPNDIGRLVNES